MFLDFFGKAIYGLGYKLTMTRNTDNAVLNKCNAISNGKSRINAIEWYVPHCTPSMQQQSILSKQIINKTPTEIQYPERSVFMKEVILKIFGLLNCEHKKILTFQHGFL